MVAANLQWTHSPSRLAWSEGWQPPSVQSSFIKWTGWTLAITQHCRGYYYYCAIKYWSLTQNYKTVHLNHYDIWWWAAANLCYKQAATATFSEANLMYRPDNTSRKAQILPGAAQIVGVVDETHPVLLIQWTINAVWVWATSMHTSTQ